MAEVRKRIVVISHVFPGVTPFNVWDLPLCVWEQYAKAADDWAASRKG